MGHTRPSVKKRLYFSKMMIYKKDRKLAKEWSACWKVDCFNVVDFCWCTTVPYYRVRGGSSYRNCVQRVTKRGQRSFCACCQYRSRVNRPSTRRFDRTPRGSSRTWFSSQGLRQTIERKSPCESTEFHPNEIIIPILRLPLTNAKDIEYKLNPVLYIPYTIYTANIKSLWYSSCPIGCSVIVIQLLRIFQISRKNIY